jgi:hypothetical protein
MIGGGSGLTGCGCRTSWRRRLAQATRTTSARVNATASASPVGIDRSRACSPSPVADGARTIRTRATGCIVTATGGQRRLLAIAATGESIREVGLPCTTGRTVSAVASRVALYAASFAVLGSIRLGADTALAAAGLTGGSDAARGEGCARADVTGSGRDGTETGGAAGRATVGAGVIVLVGSGSGAGGS